MSQSEKKNLELRLKIEVEQFLLLQKKVASLGSRLDFLSLSTDNRSCSDGKKIPLLNNFNRSRASNSQGKKRPLGGHNGVHLKKSTLGRFELKLAVAYVSPLDFAADVRLTLSNAMKYNLPENDVHIMAETLSKYFEARWKAIEKKFSITMNVVDAMPSIAAEHPIEVERN
ncbi:hypothetical protein Gogos_001271, partial [Gossypium gossypioides]|nr:hypothetical protein [Gossypium gossypioides]